MSLYHFKEQGESTFSLVPFNHTSIQEAHPRSPISLQKIVSEAQELKMITRPTKRYMRKLELKYLYCPDCEGQDLYRNGRTDKGIQRFMCKECDHQFVTQFDAVFPQNKRRAIFESEFLGNIKPTGSDKVGTGRKKYWTGARLEVMQMMESQVIKVRFNKMLKTMPIRGDRDYRVLLEFIMNEAYGRVMA